MMAVMKGFQRSADGCEASPTTAGSQTAAVSSREEQFVYLDYFMYGVPNPSTQIFLYGVFVEIYHAGWSGGAAGSQNLVVGQQSDGVVSSREDVSAYFVYFMYGVFVELYGV